MTSAQRNISLLALALLGLTLFAFRTGLGGGFIFDDYPNIVRHEGVHATTLDAESLAKAARAYDGPFGRPLATMSFAVDHALWGLDPTAFKRVNLAVHSLNGLLVFMLLLKLPLPSGRAVPQAWLAFAIALAWAVHPLQVSTVLYVVQRMEMMSLTFVLLALLCYLTGRSRQLLGARAWPWLLACLPMVSLGLLAKETAALFPAYALALEVALLGFRTQRDPAGRRWRTAYGLAVGIAVLGYLLWFVPTYVSPEAFSMRDYGPWERLLTQLRVLPLYIGWIVLPFPGSYHFYYDDFQPSLGLLHPAGTLAGAIFIAALLGLAAWLRRKLPLFSLGVLWFFAAHAVTSNIIPLELVFEHRNYFAILGVLLALIGLSPLFPRRPGIGLLRGATAAALLGLVGLTVIRSASWGDPLGLAMLLAQLNPQSSRASTDLGEQYMVLAGGDPGSRLYALAEQEFERGAGNENASIMPDQGLIVLASGAGVLPKAEWWDRIAHKLRTRAIGPQEMAVMLGMLEARDRTDVFDDAGFARAYSVLAERKQLSAPQYFAFGMHALARADDPELAMRLFEAAVLAGRSDPELVAGMIARLSSTGHADQALSVSRFARNQGIIDLDIGSPESAQGQTP